MTINSEIILQNKVKESKTSIPENRLIFKAGTRHKYRRIQLKERIISQAMARLFFKTKSRISARIARAIKAISGNIAIKLKFKLKG